MAGPFVQMKRRLLQYQAPQVFTQEKRLDFLFLGGVILLSLFGLLMVYDASQFEAFQSFSDRYYYIKQQAVSFALGLFFLIVASFFDYHRLQKLAFPTLIFALLLLVLVFVPGLGVKAYGAYRWLRIFGFTVQPAEIIKLASVIFFATLFRKGVKSTPFLLLVGLVGGIVGLLQRDLGSTVVYGLVAFGVYFIAGAPLRYFLGLAVLSILAIGGLIISAPFRVKRIMAFLDPFADPQGYSYHILQILIALGSGGLLGVGVGGSRQKFAYIPEVTTDSIFSIVGEEFGFLGALVVISLFAFFAFRGFRIAKSAPDTFGKLLASGLILWLVIQVAVNLAAMVSLMPLTGVPLPFISYGGSALVANLVAVGILLNISKQSNISS